MLIDGGDEVPWADHPGLNESAGDQALLAPRGAAVTVTNGRRLPFRRSRCSCVAGSSGGWEQWSADDYAAVEDK
jgi:hypothetical protein